MPVKISLRQLVMVFSGFLTCAVGCSRQSFDSLRSDVVVTHAADRVEVVSKVYHIDRIYPSMTGPWSQVTLTLLEQPKPELVWITGAEVEMRDATGTRRMPDELMCHANLDLNSEAYCEQMGLSKTLDGRLFTLSQGQLKVQFPPGTGIPVRSDLPLELITQVLNLNLDKPNLDVRHHVIIHFARDADVKQKMTPLYETGVSSQVSLEGQALPYDILDHGIGTQASGMCIPGQKAMDWDEQEDRWGRRFTGHWLVPPGKQTNTTRCTSIMNVPYDTRLFAIAVHLHPFAESLEFRDVTEQKTIFKSDAVNYQDRIGLQKITSFASNDGVPIYKNHEYEMVSTYNNTSPKSVDSMAVMYLYLGDTEFDATDARRRMSAEPQPQKSAVTKAENPEVPRM
jgi:hypothetical protein